MPNLASEILGNCGQARQGESGSPIFRGWYVGLRRELPGRGAAYLDHLGSLKHGKGALKINKTGHLPKHQDQGF